MGARLLRQVQILEGPTSDLRPEDVLLEDGRLAAIGPAAPAIVDVSAMVCSGLLGE
jgi:hypothetical protein